MKPIRQGIRLLLIAAVSFVAVIFTGDWIYSRLVRFRLNRWENSIKRGPDLVREGCEAFSVGRGNAAILMVHGFADSPAIWKRVASALAERGYTCRAMRLPGAAIPPRAASGFGADDWRRAVRDELAALRTRHEPVWIMAHSMGGAIALDVLLREPAAADGAILAAPLIRVSGRRSFLFPPRVWHRIAQRALLFTDLVENPFPIDLHDEKALAEYPKDRFVPAGIYEHLFALVDGIGARPAKFRIPVMIAAAPDDRIVDSEAARAYFERIEAPRKTWFSAEQAGHVIPLDFGWEELVEAADRFIRE